MLAVIDSLVSNCEPNGTDGLAAQATIGIALHGVALLTVVSLPRTRKYGRFVHCAPYAFLVAGAALLALAPDAKGPVITSLIFALLTAIMRTAAYFEMRADMKKLYGSCLEPMHHDYVRSLQAMHATTRARKTK